ncbi:MAG TPA: uroporphyrinogen-III C-methyltransferase [Longimicrobiales bacterium]|jgi:uroporphyrinogen III methyltransferase/synthase
MMNGTVYLVGAGPGDPGLLTLRGAECLGLADVVLFDYLVNPEILGHANPQADLVALGRPHSGRSFTPEEIVDRMLAEAGAGRTVVRLKGGDPSVFGRCADETGALRDAGIPYEIVPGITSGLATAAYCEIPLTQQDDASAVALVTGRERNCKQESCLDYDALAVFPGTLVFYMGVGRAKVWSTALMQRGKSPDTPVGIVQWCSRGHQRFVRCTLSTVVETIALEELRPPSVFVVGEVVARAPEESWFARRQGAASGAASPETVSWPTLVPAGVPGSD